MGESLFQGKPWWLPFKSTHCHIPQIDLFALRYGALGRELNTKVTFVLFTSVWRRDCILSLNFLSIQARPIDHWLFFPYYGLPLPTHKRSLSYMQERRLKASPPDHCTMRTLYSRIPLCPKLPCILGLTEFGPKG